MNFILALILSLSLGYTSAPRAELRLIDSKKDCSKIGGNWIAGEYNSWTYSCIAPLPDEQCEANGGRRNRSGCAFSLSEDSLAKQCTKKGGKWGKFEANQNWCFFQEEKSQCIAEGGQWIKKGKSQISSCTRVSKDGGKPCTSSSQCQFKRCLYIPEPGTENNNSQDNVVGQCVRTDNPYGCKTYVENGRVAGGSCVD